MSAPPPSRSQRHSSLQPTHPAYNRLHSPAPTHRTLPKQTNPFHSPQPRVRQPIDKLTRIELIDTFYYYFKLCIIALIVILLECIFIYNLLTAFILSTLSNMAQFAPKTALIPILLGALSSLWTLHNINAVNKHIPFSALYAKIVNLSYEEIKFDIKRRDIHLSVLKYTQLYNSHDTALQIWAGCLFVLIFVQSLVLPVVINVIRYIFIPFDGDFNVYTISPLIHTIIFIVANCIYGMFVVCYYLPDYFMRVKKKPKHIFIPTTSHGHISRNITKEKSG